MVEGYEPAQMLADVLADVCGPTRTLVYHPERGRLLRDGGYAGAWWLGARAATQAEVEAFVTAVATVHLPGLMLGRPFIAETLRRAALDPRLTATRRYRNRRDERKAERAERRRRREAGDLPDPDRPSITMPLDDQTRSGGR